MRPPKPGWEHFHVFYENADGTFHILVVTANGGYIFADRFNEGDDAEWVADLLNAALQGSAKAA